MDAGTAGASGVDMLQHAVRAVEAGDATHVLVLAGDVFAPGRFQAVAEIGQVGVDEGCDAWRVKPIAVAEELHRRVGVEAVAHVDHGNLEQL